MCADCRFHAEVERKFREATGFSETDYWIEATAGGSPAVGDTKTADYAYAHGAKKMGWAAHGSGCGGFPGVNDEVIRGKLDEVIEDRIKRYSDAAHYRIFSVEKPEGITDTSVGMVVHGEN